MNKLFKVGDMVKRNVSNRSEYHGTFPTYEACRVARVSHDGKYIGFAFDANGMPWLTQNFVLAKPNFIMDDGNKNILQAALNNKTIQVYDEASNTWNTDTDVLENMISGKQQRIKPETVIINDVRVPAPIDKFPENFDGQDFFIPSLSSSTGCMVVTFDGNSYDQICLKRGLVHLSKENALKHFEALVKPTRNGNE